MLKYDAWSKNYFRIKNEIKKLENSKHSLIVNIVRELRSKEIKCFENNPWKTLFTYPGNEIIKILHIMH